MPRISFASKCGFHLFCPDNQFAPGALLMKGVIFFPLSKKSSLIRQEKSTNGFHKKQSNKFEFFQLWWKFFPIISKFFYFRQNFPRISLVCLCAVPNRILRRLAVFVFTSFAKLCLASVTAAGASAFPEASFFF